jgi:AraC-like DNA-binding protein
MHFYILMNNAPEYPRMYLYQRLVKAKLFIDVHYAEAIDLGNISDEAYFSKFHFTRNFKKIFGKTPHQYLTGIRIDKAKLFLKEGMPVADTCFAVGFESISSFTSLFKKQTGHTPAAWQQAQLNKIAHSRSKPLHHIPGCYAATHGWRKD